MQCRKVSIDTRTDIINSLFFGLPGENFNGSMYAEEALEKGAAYAVVNDKKYVVDERVFLVDDVLNTLQQIAHRYRRTLDIPVLGITGSNGKTTTKELIYHLLQNSYKTHCTRGNFNNHIGLPLTILSAPSDTEFLILEMGASAAGEINALCEIGDPRYGLITNIGAAHLKGFGSIEGVKSAKAELYDYLKKVDGVAFINAEENYLPDLSEKIKKRIFYAANITLEITIDYLYFIEQSVPVIRVHYFDNEKIICKTSLFGYYNAMNVISAISVARTFQVPDAEIQKSLKSFKAHNNRSQIVVCEKNHYVMDAYNANPMSMKKSIESFAQLDSKMPKILILGDMKELGKESAFYHQEIIEYLQKFPWKDVYLVGPEFNSCEILPPIKSFDTTDSIIEFFKRNQISGNYILLKGSRSMTLEKIKDILK